MSPLIVHLNGRRVGVLRDEGHESTFQYDEAWLEDADACALSRQLPLRSEAFSGRPVEVFFGGLLPEADSRDQIARNLGISSENDFAMLERIGGECAGAISLLTENMSGPPAGDLRWLGDGELAEIVERLPQSPLLDRQTLRPDSRST